MRGLSIIGEMLSRGLIFDAASVVTTRAAQAGAVAGTRNTKSIGQFTKSAEATVSGVFLKCENSSDDQSDFANEKSFQGEETDSTEEKW